MIEIEVFVEYFDFKFEIEFEFGVVIEFNEEVDNVYELGVWWFEYV